MGSRFGRGLRAVGMAILLLFTVVFSVVMLGAHFWRAGKPLLALLCLGVLAFLGIRRRWAALIIQGLLWAGTAIWLGALWRAAAAKRAAGEPWGRLALILGAVAFFTALSSLVLEIPAIAAFYRKKIDSDPIFP
jgi:hypothetical protein